MRSFIFLLFVLSLRWPKLFLRPSGLLSSSSCSWSHLQSSVGPPATFPTVSPPTHQAFFQALRRKTMKGFLSSLIAGNPDINQRVKQLASFAYPACAHRVIHVADNIHQHFEFPVSQHSEATAMFTKLGAINSGARLGWRCSKQKPEALYIRRWARWHRRARWARWHRWAPVAAEGAPGASPTRTDQLQHS